MHSFRENSSVTSRRPRSTLSHAASCIAKICSSPIPIKTKEQGLWTEVVLRKRSPSPLARHEVSSKVLFLHFHDLDYTPTTSRYLSLFLTTTYDSIRRASTPTPFPLCSLISKSTLLLQQLEPRGSQAWRSSSTYLCLKRANVEDSRSLSFVQLPHQHFPLLPLQPPPHLEMMQLNAI